MKYIIGFLIIGYFGYNFFIKGKTYSRETIVKQAAGLKQKVCSNQRMLQERKISGQQCIVKYEEKFSSCSDKVESNIGNQEEADKAISSLLNCLTEHQ